MKYDGVNRGGRNSKGEVDPEKLSRTFQYGNKLCLIEGFDLVVQTSDHPSFSGVNDILLDEAGARGLIRKKLSRVQRFPGSSALVVEVLTFENHRSRRKASIP